MSWAVTHNVTALKRWVSFWYSLIAINSMVSPGLLKMRFCTFLACQKINRRIHMQNDFLRVRPPFPCESNGLIKLASLFPAQFACIRVSSGLLHCFTCYFTYAMVFHQTHFSLSRPVHLHNGLGRIWTRFPLIASCFVRTRYLPVHKWNIDLQYGGNEKLELPGSKQKYLDLKKTIQEDGSEHKLHIDRSL